MSTCKSAATMASKLLVMEAKLDQLNNKLKELEASLEDIKTNQVSFEDEPTGEVYFVNKDTKEVIFKASDLSLPTLKNIGFMLTIQDCSRKGDNIEIEDTTKEDFLKRCKQRELNDFGELISGKF